jgi:hypothetical protein
MPPKLLNELRRSGCAAPQPGSQSNLLVALINSRWAVNQPPGGSQAAPPGVSTHATGPPEFDVAVEPGAPQGIPTAGRVSRPVGGVGVVGGGECVLVVCATVVSGRADEVAVGVVVAANDGVGFGGVVVTAGGALTMGGGIAVVGAKRAGGTVLSGVGVEV